MNNITFVFFLALASLFPSIGECDIRWSIEIPLDLGKEAVAIMDGNAYPLGKVLSLPEKSRYPAYTASAWGKPGHTCASAVNALHILLSVEGEKGRTMSVIPSDTVAPAATPGTAIVLDGKGGIGLFGAWAPPVGSQIMIRKSDNSLKELPSKLSFSPGDTLTIEVDSENIPIMVDLENRPGGRVILRDMSGPSIIGRVIRPVGGTGRFEGTLYQSTGRIRANHSGVIDVSTSPYGKIGGFQIVPLKHGTSTEMASMWAMTQWMIVATEGDSPLAGNPPLFAGNLIPGPVQEEDKKATSPLGIWASYGRRSLVLCRVEGGPWRWLPEVVGREDRGLSGITHLRIYFPNDREPLKD